MRAIAVDRFQNDPSIKYFIGQPQSGGIGLTLTAAKVMQFITQMIST